MGFTHILGDTEAPYDDAMSVSQCQEQARRARGADAASLSRREQEVADLIAFGLTNAAIAKRLEVGEKTIEKHISHIFRKLNVTSRAQVAVHVVAPESHYFAEAQRDKL